VIKYIKGDLKVERFKVKNVIYLTFMAIFVFIFMQTNIVSAGDPADYTVDITIEGLEFGDRYGDGEIVVIEQSIPGTFSFVYPDDIVNQTGVINIGVNFIPEDRDTYATMYMSIEVEIEAIDVIIVFDSPIYKQHDGTDEAILPTYSVNGIIHDSVSVIGVLEGKYATTLISDNIPIILSGLSLQGTYSGAYNLVLDGHTGRIHPSYLQDLANRVTLDLDDDVFISGNYNLNLKSEKESKIVNEKYTSFNKYSFLVYDQNGRKLEIKGKYEVSLRVDDKIMKKERLALFELDENNNYKELEYTYNNGIIYFEMDTDSSLVFTTRNVEYHFIIIFSGILLFSLGFVVVYTIKNSKINEQATIKEEDWWNISVQM